MHVRLQLFTVPGQVYFNATRKLVLTGADGVVFVGDSQIVRADANLESLENLRENLSEQGRDLGQIPIVFQHNKRDLPDLLPVEELDSMLNPFGAPSIPTSAKTGEGIYEALEKISERVLDVFKDRLPELSDGEIDASSFEPVEGGLVTALRDVTQRDEPPDDVVIARIGAPGTHLSIPPETHVEDLFDAPEDEAPGAHPDDGAAGPVPDDMEETVPVAPRLSSIPTADVLPAQSPFAVTSQGSAGPAVSLEDEAPPASTPGPASVRMPQGPFVRGEDKPTGVSFAELWPEGEQDMVRDLEDAIARGRYWRAIELCETLVSRAFASAAALFSTSDAPRDAAVVSMMLGLDGRRYLAFRSIVREARGDGLITAREALSAYAFAIDCRLARSAIH
jgi:hypothetical protein